MSFRSVACGRQSQGGAFVPTTIMALNREEILEQFEEFRKGIDDQNDKLERLIKASQGPTLDYDADMI